MLCHTQHGPFPRGRGHEHTDIHYSASIFICRKKSFSLVQFQKSRKTRFFHVSGKGRTWRLANSCSVYEASTPLCVSLDPPCINIPYLTEFLCSAAFSPFHNRAPSPSQAGSSQQHPCLRALNEAKTNRMQTYNCTILAQ